MNRITFTVIILLLIVAIALAWTTDHYHGNAVRYKDQRDTATHNLKLANETITDMTKRQRDVAALDEKYTKELADAQTRILICSAALLLVAGCASKDDVQCPPRPKPPAPAAWAMLPPSNSLRVLDKRSQYPRRSSATRKLKYLQEYVRTQCR